MAEKSLSLGELLRKLMGDEHADVLRETLAWFVGVLREAEVPGQIGAGLHERSPDRTTHRNGYRERVWRTRRRDHAADPATARGQLLPQLPRAAGSTASSPNWGSGA